MTFIFFNLLVNSIFSLLIGLVLVYAFLWFFRVDTGRWKLFLLSLPFVKIVYDFARGVPARSVLFSGVDPFSLPPKHQLLSIDAGLDGLAPFVSTIFSVHALYGTFYNSSIGDYLLLWLHREFGRAVPVAIVCAILAISLSLIFFRLFQYYRFDMRRRVERDSLIPICSVQAGLRRVDVYVSPGFGETPFTGGIFRPYICFPEAAFRKLDPEEYKAVFAHEMGHIFYYDLVVTVLIKTLGDLFWFVPGYRCLSRQIDRLREIVADRWAVSSGIEAQLLASALLKLTEIPERDEPLILYSAFFRDKSLLKERIERLIGKVEDKSPRFGWQNRWVRYAVTLFISVAVLNSVFGGNFRKEASIKVSCVCISHRFYAQA